MGTVVEESTVYGITNKMGSQLGAGKPLQTYIGGTVSDALGNSTLKTLNPSPPSDTGARTPY